MKTSSAGFTLIEVMISLAIAALVLTTLGGLQIALMRATEQATGRFDRIRNMVYFLQESRTKPTEQGKKRTEVREPLSLSYERVSIPSGSSLRGMKNLMIERVEAEWMGKIRKQRDAIVTFMYEPELSDETRTQST